MVEKQAGKTAAAVGAGSLLGTALGLFLGRQAKAAPSEGEVSLDEAAMAAILAIAQDAQDIHNIVEQLGAVPGLLAAIADALGAEGLSLENPNNFVAFPVLVSVPGTPQQAPEHRVPYKTKVLIKAQWWNTNMVYIARSVAEVIDIHSRYYLLRNETIALEIDSTRHLFVDAAVAGEGVVCIVEKRTPGLGD